jgi:hypothetical protein
VVEKVRFRTLADCRGIHLLSVNSLHERPARDRCRLWLCDDPEGTDNTVGDPSRDCFVWVVSASSSSDPEPTPRHRATDGQ